MSLTVDIVIAVFVFFVSGLITYGGQVRHHR